MKKLISLLMCLAFVTGCASANKADTALNTDKTIEVAVFKNKGTQQEYFEKGIEEAYNDVLEEYKNSGYKIICEFYDNNGTYENVAEITERLVKDPSLTAIIGSDTADIFENQAALAQKNKKILIGSGWVEDDMMTSENYMVFSMINSNDDIAAALTRVTEELPDMNWAVCASNDNIATIEAQYFRKKEMSNVLDYCDVDDLGVYFDRIKERWQSLDIKGVVLLPYNDEGFGLLYNLKAKMPDLYVVSDFDLDSQSEYRANKEKYKNVYIADGFAVDKKSEKYIQKGGFEDTWMTHGYNTFRMIVDTAVANNTSNPEKIAEIIHSKGYEGIGESFKFAKNGLLVPERYNYIDLGTLEEYSCDVQQKGAEK